MGRFVPKLTIASVSPLVQSSCVSNRDRDPSARRDGQSYDFELERSNAQCRDSNRRLYPYGGYDDIRVRKTTYLPLAANTPTFAHSENPFFIECP